MKLTSDNVATVFKACLFKEGEPTDNHVKAEGIIHSIGFHPERLKAHEADVRSMLEELPDEFHATKGGGWSFLNACQTRDGVQWGEHMNMEQLFCLGIALGLARWQFPREIWKLLPGSMPYISVL